MSIVVCFISHQIFYFLAFVDGARRRTVEVRRVVRAGVVTINVDGVVVAMRARQIRSIVRCGATTSVNVPMIGLNVTTRQVDRVVCGRRRTVQVHAITVCLWLDWRYSVSTRTI
jgi:hypothetical protein